MPSKPDATLIEEALRGWHTLNLMLPKLTRRQVARLLEAELKGRRRVSIVKRLYQRLARMRANDEFRHLKKLPNTPIDWLERELV